MAEAPVLASAAAAPDVILPTVGPLGGVTKEQVEKWIRDIPATAETMVLTIEGELQPHSDPRSGRMNPPSNFHMPLLLRYASELGFKLITQNHAQNGFRHFVYTMMRDAAAAPLQQIQVIRLRIMIGQAAAAHYGVRDRSSGASILWG
jgi:hypothetical protein